MLSTDEHPSAERVLARVQASFPMLSRATVYNTLRLFSEKKMIRELFVDPQRVVYDSTTAPHHHLYNIDSGEVRDISDDELRVIGQPRLPAGVVPKSKVSVPDVMLLVGDR